MNWVLLKKLEQKNRLLYWAFTGVIVFYFAMVVMMYPMIIDMMSGENSGMLGDFTAGWDNIGIYAVSLISEIVFSFGMILFVMLVFRLVHKPIEGGSLVPYLMVGISRTTYIKTVAAYLGMKLLLLFVLVLSIGMLSFVALGETFIFTDFFLSVLMAVLALAAVIFVSFFIASVRPGMGLIIGIPVVFYLMMLLSQLYSGIEFLRWFSVFGWYDATGLAVGDGGLWWLVAIIYISMIAASFIFSARIFKKRNLGL
ncbi:MAG: hypothetical protein FWE38_04815 [Firmicutes bacterium]|nr:hypothetical protein [Bacillota bacterium]